MWDGWAVVIESRDIKLHGLLTSATIVRVVTLTLWKLLRFFELIYLPAVCTMAFVSAISGFSPTVFGCSVIEYHLFRGGERERRAPLCRKASSSLFASYDAILLLFEQIHSRLSALRSAAAMPSLSLSLFLSRARLRRGEEGDSRDDRETKNIPCPLAIN